MTTTTPSSTPSSVVTRSVGSDTGGRGALRQSVIFLGVTYSLLIGSTAIAFSQDVNVRHIEDASALGQAAMYTQALFPLIGAVVARLAVRGTLRGARAEWGFRRAPLSVIGLGWAYGVFAAGLGGLVWLTGLGGFDGDAFGGKTIAGLSLLVLPYLVLAIGEDVGWRGTLTTRLGEISSPRTVILVSGLAWSVFHWPLMLLLGGAPDGMPKLLALALFTIGSSVAFGAVLASMQARWGIWPGVITHAVFNATLYHVIDPLLVEEDHTAWFAAETGIFVTLGCVIGAALFLRTWPLPDRRV